MSGGPLLNMGAALQFAASERPEEPIRQPLQRLQLCRFYLAHQLEVHAWPQAIVARWSDLVSPML